jgi:hypothetical protein
VIGMHRIKSLANGIMWSWDTYHFDWCQSGQLSNCAHARIPVIFYINFLSLAFSSLCRVSLSHGPL